MSAGWGAALIEVATATSGSGHSDFQKQPQQSAALQSALGGGGISPASLVRSAVGGTPPGQQDQPVTDWPLGGGEGHAPHN